LFSGTIRSNLDPLNKCTTEECMQVLESCHLLPLLNHEPSEDEPTVLDIRISQDSMSAGEKQLLALARATLRRTNIIIMDEATSQIDSNLDDQVWLIDSTQCSLM
jgi:ABC-type multidrug transport system fused ATPase/permease subunit